MGYTHYFDLRQNHKRTAIEKLKENVDAVLAEHKDIIQYEYDDNRSAVCRITPTNEIVIRFNGIENDGLETFYFHSSENKSDFCKTARNPYDIVVCKILLLLFDFYGSKAFDLGSDGFSNTQPKDRYYITGDVVRPSAMDGVWDDALMWFNRTFKNQLEFKVLGTHGEQNRYFNAKVSKVN